MMNDRFPRLRSGLFGLLVSERFQKEAGTLDAAAAGHGIPPETVAPDDPKIALARITAAALAGVEGGLDITDLDRTALIKLSMAA